MIMDQDQSKILLVEGLDDKRVITEILHAWDTPCPHIEPCDGCENLFRMLKGYISNPGCYKVIGVVLDADANPEGRMQHFVEILKGSGRYDVERIGALSAGGLVIGMGGEDAARVGLWIMPDNQSHGMLEDFLTGLADAVHPELLVEAERALVNLERNEIQQYTPAHRPKAKMHTYLAWQKEPGRTLACAVAKHYFDASSEKTRPFIDWVARLYA